MSSFRINSFVQIILAIIFGVLFGILFKTQAKELKVIADCYIQLIKMVINPLLFIAVVLGICSHNKTKITLLATKTLIYFEILSAIAILLAFGIMILIRPGDGFNISLLSPEQLSTMHTEVPQNDHNSIANFLQSIIPNNFFGVLSGNNLIAVLILAIIFAISIRRMRTHYDKVLAFFEVSSHVFYEVINVITKLAPLATFAAFAASVSVLGLNILQLSFYFIIVFTLCCFAFLIVLYIIGKIFGFSLIKLIEHIREELFIVLGTSSSESVFPQMMLKLESFGCSKNIVSFVLPASYAFNLDGTAIYVAAACIFFQQVFQISFTYHEYFILFAVIMVISKGAAGVTGAGFVTLSAVLFSLPHNMLPTEQGLALIIGIDRIMSMLRSLTNLIGSGMATVIIAKSEKEFHPPEESYEFN